MSYALDIQITDDYGTLKGPFYQNANFALKYTNENWNPHGHNFSEEYLLVWIATIAYELSKSETISEDPFVPGMNWGNGMWPSWQLARWTLLSNNIYGAQLLDQVSLGSLYGMAFSYADKTGNDGLYTGSIDQTESNHSAINTYFEEVSNGADLLDFILYVPIGLGSIGGVKIPNVEETDNLEKIFTAHFNRGQEIW